MQTYNLFSNQQDSLLGGSADLLLIGFNTLNEFEFIQTQNSQTPHGILFSPLLITRGVHNISPFSKIETRNLKATSKSAKDIFGDGMAFGRTYDLKGSYLILSLCSLNAIQNAEQTLCRLLEQTPASNFEKLSLSCDTALIFCAGFLLEATRRFHVLVSGGFEMALCLYIADVLREDVLMRLKSQNLTYATTAVALNEQKIEALLEKLSYKPHALYSAFDLDSTEIAEMKGIFSKIKDTSGAGAALAYAVSNGITNSALLSEMELIVYMA